MPGRPSMLALARRSVAGAEARLSEAWEGYRRSASGEELHELRVSLRRVAAVSALFRGFPGRESGREVEELASVARRRLSPCRQAEVSAALLAELLPRLPPPARAVRLPSSFLRPPGPEDLSEIPLL